MVRIRTVVLLTAVVLLTGSCGGGRSHLEVLRPLTREYQKTILFLFLNTGQVKPVVDVGLQILVGLSSLW